MARQRTNQRPPNRAREVGGYSGMGQQRPPQYDYNPQPWGNQNPWDYYANQNPQGEELNAFRQDRLRFGQQPRFGNDPISDYYRNQYNYMMDYIRQPGAPGRTNMRQDLQNLIRDYPLEMQMWNSINNMPNAQSGIGAPQQYNPSPYSQMLNSQMQSMMGMPSTAGYANMYGDRFTFGGAGQGGQGGPSNIGMMAPWMQGGQPGQPQPGQPSISASPGGGYQPMAGMSPGDGGQPPPQPGNGYNTDYLNNYLANGYQSPLEGMGQFEFGMQLPQSPGFYGNVPTAGDYRSAVAGDLSGIGQQAGQSQLELLQQMAGNTGVLDEATRAKLLAPAQEQSRRIAEEQYNRLLSHGENLGFNTDYMSNVGADVAESASRPLISAEADLINQGLNRQLQRQQSAAQGLGNIAGREQQYDISGRQLGLGAVQSQGDFALGAGQLGLQEAQSAGQFALGRAGLGIDKGRLMLDSRRIEQDGKLTANGQRIQEQLGKAGLNLDKYKTDRGFDLEEAQFDYMKELKDRGMSLNERIQAADEFYRGMGVTMDAQSRDWMRQAQMAELLQNAGQWDDDQRYKYTALNVESRLRAMGLDSTNARFAAQLMADQLLNRRKLDQEELQFLEQMKMAGDQGGFGEFAGQVAGTGIGSFFGGAGAAAGGRFGEWAGGGF